MARRKAPKNIPASSLEIFTVKAQSGLEGWRARLRTNYENSYETFEQFDGIYNIAHRLGYSSRSAAWNANPVIEGSVNPSDFRKVQD